MDSSSIFYLKLIYNFILQSIIMYYITFKIKFLLLAFNLTPFLRKKKTACKRVCTYKQSFKTCNLNFSII